jgi:outer membrane protein assembly factor BamA
VAQKFYLDEDRWKTRALATYLDVRYNFYGLGTAAGDQGTSVLMEQRGYGAMGEVLYRFHELWYAGGQYRVLKLDSSFRPNPAFDTSVIDPNQLDTITAAVVPRFARDSRDDLNYPRKGSLFEFRAALNGSKVGSELTYQLYNLSYNRYVSLSPKQVFAVRGAACLGRGDVPFFNECVLTTAENLRGYRASRYMDDAMVAFQSEYRLEIWNRLGAVAFAGAGQVGSRFSDFDWGNVRPGGGIGARVRITQKGHVNMRFDYAWGKNSRQGYFFLGEAF